MRIWIGLCILGVCLSTMSACATIISKSEMQQLGQPFSGVRLDAGVTACLWGAALSPDTKPAVLGNLIYFWTGWGPVGDMVLSGVLDTLVYPIDVWVGPQPDTLTVLSTPAILPRCGTGRLAPAPHQRN